jgi:hypothetical protein
MLGRNDALIVLIPIGALLALTGWVTAGIVVAIAGFVGTLALHLWQGIAGYRRAMDHEWPKVEARRWDDDW